MTNAFAGMGSHQSARSQTDEWLTPPFILEALGPFDLDPCAPVIRPWDTARHHFTFEDNGLLKDWWGRVWLNPPYGRETGRWLARLAAHNRGTSLIFARTETKHFFRYVWDSAAAVLFIRGRLNFHRVDGTRARRNCGAPTVLLAYGRADADRLFDSSIEGKFVPLQIPRLVAVALADGCPTWAELIRDQMRGRGPVHLDALYRAIAGHPKTRANSHWRAKVRQVLQKGNFRRHGNGVWEAA